MQILFLMSTLSVVLFFGGWLSPLSLFVYEDPLASPFWVGSKSSIYAFRFCLGEGSVSEVSLRPVNGFRLESISSFVFRLGNFNLRNLCMHLIGYHEVFSFNTAKT